MLETMIFINKKKTKNYNKEERIAFFFVVTLKYFVTYQTFLAKTHLKTEMNFS